MQENEIILYQPDDTVKLEVRSKIQIIRGTAVMIDRDLAVLYSVDTKRINEQARRNIERFPDRFRFQLTNEETSQLVAFCDRFKALKHSKETVCVFQNGCSRGMVGTVIFTYPPLPRQEIDRDLVVAGHFFAFHLGGLPRRHVGDQPLGFLVQQRMNPLHYSHS